MYTIRFANYANALKIMEKLCYTILFCANSFHFLLYYYHIVIVLFIIVLMATYLCCVASFNVWNMNHIIFPYSHFFAHFLSMVFSFFSPFTSDTLYYVFFFNDMWICTFRAISFVCSFIRWWAKWFLLIFHPVRLRDFVYYENSVEKCTSTWI